MVPLGRDGYTRDGMLERALLPAALEAAPVSDEEEAESASNDDDEDGEVAKGALGREFFKMRAMVSIVLPKPICSHKNPPREVLMGGGSFKISWLMGE